MPFLRTNGINLHYQFDGPEDAPVLLFSNSIGTDMFAWDGVIDELRREYRILRYDSRGHGISEVPCGPYSIAMLGTDILGMLSELGIKKVHFCGLSLGGMLGMWFAANYPKYIDKLILCNTAAWIPPPESWDVRAEAVRNGGMQALKPAVLERWLSAEFREQQTEAVKRLISMVESSPAHGYIGSCAAIRDMDQRVLIQKITARTLVVAGVKDIATPPVNLRFIASILANKASYVELDCGHMSNVEKPVELSTEIKKFLK